MIRRWVVMWKPPDHQSLYTGDHPTGHGCEVCTTHRPPRVDSRHFTFRGAERRVDRLMKWSLRPGRWWVAPR